MTHTFFVEIEREGKRPTIVVIADEVLFMDSGLVRFYLENVIAYSFAPGVWRQITRAGLPLVDAKDIIKHEVNRGLNEETSE